MENFDYHCQRPENSNQIQFGSDKSLTIANVLNLEPIIYFVKSHLKKGKTQTYIFAQSSILHISIVKAV